ncbi:MAG: hypothetical protein U1E10_06440 [Bdellovibrionales bacterium]|nr:hypothetical protein [Bdellovibrionales bacterium]
MKSTNHKMTLLAVTGLTLLMSLVVGSASEARERHDRRQTRQNVRTHQGAQNDQLTAGEKHRLQKSKRAIRRTEKRFENNDGEIGKKEAIVLEQMQDARSKQIYRLKHNDKTKGDGNVTAPVEPQPALPAEDSSAGQ